MAKRELINKKKLIGKMKQSNAFDISERMKFSNLIEDQKLITEQEIVKPYLEKLKEQMKNKEREVEFMNDWADGWNSCLNEILLAIDTQLSGAGDTDMKYKDIKNLLKNFLMNQYDIRPSLAERTVDEMFRKGAEYISLEEQRSKNEL